VKHERKSVCLIAGGLIDSNLRLQPWRYLIEVARQLAGQGHRVTVISDGSDSASVQSLGDGVLVYRVPTVSQPWWRVSSPMRQIIQQIRPEVLLWHVGLTSFAHQDLDGWGQIPIVGIFTSPIYRPQEIFRLGLSKITRGYNLSAVHTLGALTPRPYLRQLMRRNKWRCLVVQTQTTRQRLLADGLWTRPIEVIAPGIDKVWSASRAKGAPETRAMLGYSPSDKVVLYFGSPAPLRGLHTLTRAFEMARCADPSLKLLVLSRRRAAELLKEDAELRQLLQHSPLSQHVQVVSSFLDEETLVRHVAACDVVALPFELVPSDAPLSLLEAQALGKPVVTTRVACLPELAAHGVSYLAHPADPLSLAEALKQAGTALSNHRQDTGLTVGSDRPVSSGRSWQEMGEEWSHFVERL
jgi:glycosyltransferase involved in cell wall biosynthesis